MYSPGLTGPPKGLLRMFCRQKTWGRPLVGLAVALLVAGGAQAQDAPPPGEAAVSVETVVVQPRPFTMKAELPGRIEAARLAEVRARVAGIVLSRHFEEGAEVEAGQLLFQIDPAPLKAALARAQAELAKAEATLGEARSVLRRYEPLVKRQVISPQDFDTAQASLQIAEAARQSAAAELETARLNLEYATVRAPISGRIGRGLVTEGALVGQGESTAMAVIHQLDPIYADFRQPVADMVRLRESLAAGRLEQSAADLPLSITVEGSSQQREGQLVFSDVTVDRSTGQVLLRGKFPNSDGLLLPGMFVRVHLPQGLDRQAVLVPQRAVRPQSDGTAQVLVVDGNRTVQARTVKTGVMQGSQWQIISGLDAGERVIVGGAATVQPGAQVNVSEPSAAAQPALAQN